MRKYRIPLILLAFFLALGIIILLRFTILTEKPHLNDKTPTSLKAQQSNTHESFLGDTSQLSEEEKQLYRNGDIKERAALAALHYTREWNREVLQDPMASQDERIEVIIQLERLEEVVSEIKKLHKK